MDFDKFCNDIMDLDPKVRFVGVVSKNGKLVAGGHKDGSESLLTDEEANMSFHYATQRWETRSNLSHRIGEERYSMTEYEKIKQISVPLDNRNILLVSAELDADHDKIIQRSLDMIQDKKDS